MLTGQEREPEDMEVQADLDEMSVHDDDDAGGSGSADDEALDTDDEDEGDATIDTDVSDGEYLPRPRRTVRNVDRDLSTQCLCISYPFILCCRARTR